LTHLRRWSPPAAVKQPIRAFLSRFGFELVRLRRPATKHTQQLFRDRRINVLVDVGANQGQYAMRMRALGYRDRIHSFEPGAEALRLLSRHARADHLWQVHPYALGATNRTQVLYVSRDSVSSSLLAVELPHILAAPASVPSYTEEIAVRRLDDLLQFTARDNVWLKLDTQGSEWDVLLGAARALRSVQVVQTELSLLPCYEGQSEYEQIFGLLHSEGFRLSSVEPGTQDLTTGALLQFDAVFLRWSTVDSS
jgi:FkbM family methyltransferase